MKKAINLILFIFAVQWAINAYGAAPLPSAITGFCELAFAGHIARKGQRFNATDVIEKGVPRRRILGYLVGKDDAYLWYEHGGRSLHQHLVKFSNTPPYEVRASYVFNTTTHRDIHQLIKDSRFLASHLTNHCGL